MNNNRAWFQAHRETYEDAVREPMKALVGEFAARFGPGKLSRINRDNRFFKDRPPYKTHIDAGVGGYTDTIIRSLRDSRADFAS